MALLHLFLAQAAADPTKGLTAIGRGIVYGGAAIGPGIGIGLVVGNAIPRGNPEVEAVLDPPEELVPIGLRDPQQDADRLHRQLRREVVGGRPRVTARAAAA